MKEFKGIIFSKNSSSSFFCRMDLFYRGGYKVQIVSVYKVQSVSLYKVLNSVSKKLGIL